MRPVISDTPYKHIFIMDDGRAMIGGTRIKVEYIAVYDRSGMSAEEIRKSYPSLTMGQIYSALAYYCDNKALVEAQIEEGDRYVEKMRAANEPVQAEFRKRMAKWRAERAEGAEAGAVESL